MGFNTKQKLTETDRIKITNDILEQITPIIENLKIIISNETETAKEIQPNVFYVWGEVASLDITLASPSDTDTVNEYMFQFVSGEAATTLTLPDSVKWAEQPLIEPNSTYQVSIVNNIGLMIGVGNT